MTGIVRLAALACLGLSVLSPPAEAAGPKRGYGNYGNYGHFEGPGYKGWGYYDRLGFDPFRRDRSYINSDGYHVGCWKWTKSGHRWTKSYICAPQH